MITRVWSDRALQCARYAALLALFCLPISKAAVNACLSLTVLFVILHPAFWRSFGALGELLVVRTTIFLFGMIWIGAIYSSGDTKDILDIAGSYRRLLLIPILIWLFQESPLVRRAPQFFFAGALVTLAVSCLNFFEVINFYRVYDGFKDQRAVVFQHPIAQSIFMVTLMFFALIYARSTLRKWRYLLFGIAILAFSNVFFMLAQRTGQFCVIGLVLWILGCWAFMLVREKINLSTIFKIVGAFTAFVLITTILLTRDHTRLNGLWTEVAHVEQNGAETSAGQRILFWRMAEDIFRRHPILGSGTGSMKVETKQIIDRHQTTFSTAIRDPHNQFLYFSAELGVVGLTLFLWFLWSLWRSAAQLERDQALILCSVVLIFVVDALFNSALNDSKSAHLLVLFSGILLAPILRDGKRSRSQGVES